MSVISKLFAVRPTGTVDKVSIDPIETAAALASGYTNIVSLRVGDNPYLCAYNNKTGNTDLYLLTEAEPWMTLVESRIDLSGGPWDKLTTFILGNDPYLLTYRAKDGMFNFYRVAPDLSASPPYSFYFARNTPTAGFTEIAPISSLGAQYVLGYNFDDGTVAAFSVSVTTTSASGVPPLVALNVWYHHWAKGWTRFAFFQLGGANFFFKINTAKLNVNIDHLNDNPAAGTVEVGSFLQSQLPDALSITNSAILPWSHGDPYLVTYISASGVTSVYRIHGDCLGWTETAKATTVANASIVVPYAIGDNSYALFYGANS
jgi:hypothetical protein